MRKKINWHRCVIAMVLPIPFTVPICIFIDNPVVAPIVAVIMGFVITTVYLKKYPSVYFE